jgi:predicted nucleic acid-binding protein
VERSLILETTFLVDLEREARRESPGVAYALLERHATDRLYVTPTIAGELASGTSMKDRDRWDRFLAPFVSLPITPDVAWRYGESYRYLQANGLLIGANDLWIAAVGLAHGLPVVTRDAADFRRVPGLEVVAYT